MDVKNYSPLKNFIANLPIDTLSTESKIWYRYDNKKIHKPITSETEKLRIGYRVQVQISDDYLVIDSIKTEIQKILPNLPQYVIYEPPFYKLRIGDFDSKSQANKYLNILEKNGYITSRIIIDKLE